MNRVMNAMPGVGVGICIALLAILMMAAGPGRGSVTVETTLEEFVRKIDILIDEVGTSNEIAERRREMMHMDMCLNLDRQDHYRAAAHKQKRVKRKLGCEQLWADLER